MKSYVLIIVPIFIFLCISKKNTKEPDIESNSDETDIVIIN